jgi:hypothetical protein
MDLFNSLIHDQVVLASASTYNPIEIARLGVRMDINLSNKKIRSVNGYYPDIVIWKPDYQGSNEGQAILVEIIETSIPLNPDINKWIALCGVGIRVNIIVNESQRQNAANLIGQYRLSNCFLQTYRFDSTQNRYIFTKV